VVLAAVRKNGTALYSASAELRGNRDVAMAAVRNTGWALQCASAELRGDKNFVIAAVRIAGYSLQFASQQLRVDRDVVLSADKQDANALRFASEKLKAYNGEIVLAALLRSPKRALKFLSQESIVALARHCLEHRTGGSKAKAKSKNAAQQVAYQGPPKKKHRAK